MRNIGSILASVKRRLTWAACRLVPVKKNKIVISSYCGRGYGDNPKYICEELLSRGENVEIVWLVKNSVEAKSLPKGIRSCDFNSLSAIYHMTTAKVWIDNCRKFFRYKKKSQYYMQTWHGFALKRIERDVEDKLDPPYVEAAIKDSANTDIIISDSRFMTKIYKESFWYDGEVVEWGSPRNDVIISQNSDVAKKVRAHLGLGENVKTVLYAPTFRSNKSTEPYSVDYERLCKACEKRFGGEFAALVRLHPNVVDKCKDLNFNDKVINATLYPDMQELLSFADIVITDYSSLMFDFSLMLKPCFQYATDIEDYKGDRNFYFQIDTLPFDLCENNDELERAVLNFNEDEYGSRLESFFDGVGMNREGTASKKCADWIMEKISE